MLSVQTTYTYTHQDGVKQTVPEFVVALYNAHAYPDGVVGEMCNTSCIKWLMTVMEMQLTDARLLHEALLRVARVQPL